MLFLEEAVHAFSVARHQMVSDGPAGLDPNMSMVLHVCGHHVEVGELLRHLTHWLLHVELMADHASAYILNMYFTAGKDAAGVFIVDQDMRQQGRRWSLLRRLLEMAGCAERHCRMVEVGVYAAETSVHLLRHLPLLHLHGVDPYMASEEYPGVGNETYAEASRLYAQFWPRAALHRTTSRDFAPSVGVVDLVFLDGSHIYEHVVEDLALWSSKALCVAGHDLNLPNGGVTRAVHEWAQGRPVHMLPDGVWFVWPSRFEMTAG